MIGKICQKTDNEYEKEGRMFHDPRIKIDGKQSLGYYRPTSQKNHSIH